MFFRIALFILCMLFTSCASKYAIPQQTFTKLETDYCLVILVDARHLDYTTVHTFLRSLQKQSNPYHNPGRFGHAWIRLISPDRVIEGGHSGERGLDTPQYFEGIMDLVDAHDPNPVRYLWATQPDGYFEEGSGGHTPTYAAAIAITPEQYRQIRELLSHQNYSDYTITDGQCASFAAKAASVAGLQLDYEATIAIPPTIYFGGRTMLLWTDPAYSSITFGTPDVLETSLRCAVDAGLAQPAIR